MIHHIVMQQRGGMNQLHHRRQRQVGVALQTTGPGSEDGDRWAQSLAPTAHQMAAQVFGQPRMGAQRTFDEPIGCDELIGNELQGRLQRSLLTL
jgi:hypothetical protein